MLQRLCSQIARPVVASTFRSVVPAAAAGVQRRFFSAEGQKLLKTITAEVRHEQSNYEKPDIIKTFVEKNEWKFEEKDSDVNMVLVKETKDGYKVSVDFQLTSPIGQEGFEGEGAQDDEMGGEEVTDFSITVENKSGSGMTFYCSTSGGDQAHRFLIGNVRQFANAEEKENPSAYNGPEFEDLDESLQEGLDEWLASLGVNEELCDLIDAAAIDKEQREYMRWLSNFQKFFEK
eukprot:GDKI01030418.1.p2 GENE.GDKI01030418.1~~GDKI01030418.1.p2  ORF type:complete len:251 (+),score=100.69 GDKI01030418.1:55-753(+)